MGNIPGIVETVLSVPFLWEALNQQFEAGDKNMSWAFIVAAPILILVAGFQFRQDQKAIRSALEEAQSRESRFKKTGFSIGENYALDWVVFGVLLAGASALAIGLMLLSKRRSIVDQIFKV